jgi:hypothetical protein
MMKKSNKEDDLSEDSDEDEKKSNSNDNEEEEDDDEDVEMAIKQEDLIVSIIYTYCKHY